MSRPANRENLKSLADQLVWAITNYVKAGIDDIKGDGWANPEDTLKALGDFGTHNTGIFPAATNLTCTLTAHEYINTWGAWTELSDSIENTLTSMFSASSGHITAIMVEETQSAGERWIIEIGYGDSYIRVATMRFISGSVGILPAIQQMRIRSNHIPAGETIYGRLMCSKANSETCTIHIRYFLH